MVVADGEGSDNHPGDPDTGDVAMYPGIGDSVFPILKALGGS